MSTTEQLDTATLVQQAETWDKEATVHQTQAEESRKQAEEAELAAQKCQQQANILRQTAEQLQAVESGQLLQPQPRKAAATGQKRRGRPKGSTNKTATPKATAKGKRGRPKGSKNQSKASESNGKAPANLKRAKNDTTLKELVMKILKKNRSGLELKDIVAKCHEAGYKSNTKDDFSKIVYQQLYKLMKSDKFVSKDDGHKYSLSAKGKEAA